MGHGEFTDIARGKFEGNDGRTPKFDYSESACVLMDAARKGLGVTQEGLALELISLVNQDKGTYKFELNVMLEQRTISDALTDFTNQTIGIREVRRIIWIWLHITDHKAGRISLIRDNTTRGYPSSLINALSEQIHSATNFEAQPPKNILDRISGRYAFYRLFFGDMKSILVSELRCGVNSNKSLFEMVMKHDWPKKGAPPEIARGVMVPFEGGVLFQGVLAGRGGPFIFTMRLTRDGDGKISCGEGVLLASAGAEVSSSYPTFMIRSDDQVEMGVFDQEYFMKDEETWELIRPITTRGCVKWRN